MNATPTTANATPIASNGHFVPFESSGSRRPAPKLTANEVSPVRHHARYVRSLASRVRRLASRASSKRSGTAASLRLLEVLPSQSEEHPVDPLAVPQIGAALHALAHEAGALCVGDRAVVEAVDLELEPVVVE